MSDSPQTRLRQIIEAAGSRPAAQRALAEAVTRDHALLLMVAQPFLKAILGAAVDRVLGRAVPTAAQPAHAFVARPVGAAPTAQNAAGAKAAASLLGQQGLREVAADAPRPKSHSQADAIKALAAAYRRK